MNKIERLIEALCPEGVEHRKLWEVTAWDKNFNAVASGKQSRVQSYKYLLASKLREMSSTDPSADVKLLGTGMEDFGFTTEEIAGVYLAFGEIVSIPWGGRASVQYHKGKFVTADNRIATSLDPEILQVKFLYYYLIDNLDTLQSFYRGSGIQHPSMAKVLDLVIPLPPVEVQLEVVSILDKFTELEAELEGEIEARTSQFEALRRNFFHEASSVSLVELGSLCEMYSGEFVKKDRQGDDFLYPVYNGGSEPTGFYSEFNSPENSIVIASRGSIGSVSFVTTPFWAGNSCFVLRNPVQELNYRFLYHFLKYSEPELYKLRAVGTIPAINLKPLLTFEIPIPSVQEQERISSILDRFEQLESDTKLGLPAEITARRQQYEYYRNKLLTFKELRAS